MPLLERGQALDALTALLEPLKLCRGAVAVVSGEAGIGKTALLRRFKETVPRQIRWVSGMCDDLQTPQALTPFYDIAHQLDPALVEAISEAKDLQRVGHRLLRALEVTETPTAMVIEDLHWADEATLDLVRFISRRIRDIQCLLVLTMRQEGNTLPILGHLPQEDLHRISLQPLSVDAVGQLTGDGVLDANEVYALTGGNPFYVSEVVESGSSRLPQSVRDAVLARVERLSPEARIVLEAVSVVPGQAEEWLVAQLVGPMTSALEENLAAGLLRLDQGIVAFRHEIARRAIEGAIPPLRSRRLHRDVFEALDQKPSSRIRLSRKIHHAAAAGHGDAVLRLAPLAAKQSAAVSAFRDAAAYYETALRHADRLDPRLRAELVEGRAEATYLGVNWEAAVELYQEVLELWRELEESARVGAVMRRLSRICWGLARVEDSRRYAIESIRVLRRLPAGDELAMAYSALGLWHMQQNHYALAIHWSERAKTLAESVGAARPEVDASINVGFTIAKQDSPRGVELLERALADSLRHRFTDQACRTYFNVVNALIEAQELDRAEAHVRSAVAFTKDRELNTYRAALQAQHARIALLRGHWESAAETATHVVRSLRHESVLGAASLISTGVLAVIAARRGQRDADARCADLLHNTQGHLKLVDDAGHVLLPRAEAAWLRGDMDGGAAEAKALLTLLDGRPDRWFISWAAYWLWRCTGELLSDVPLLEPHRYEISGQWQSAADAWTERGFVYHAAMARVAGDAGAALEAFDRLDALGAHASLRYVRKRLRALGVNSVPRGRNTATRQNPLGLTGRQLGVLELLEEGLTNPEIAARLFVSPKTVGHHVSAILAKLGVTSRSEAAALARGLKE